MPGRAITAMRKGAGVTELAHYLGVSRETIYRWCDSEDKQYHRPFAEAVALGRELSEAWWMRFGRLAMMGKVPAAPPSWWIFNMKNRFGWRDRVEVGGSQESAVHIVKKVYVIEGPPPDEAPT